MAAHRMEPRRLGGETVEQPVAEIPPPPRSRRSLLSARSSSVRSPSARSLVILALALVVVFLFGRSLIADPNERLNAILPARIEDTFKREGIELRVESVSCEDLSGETSVFTVTCGVEVVEITETVEIIVQGSIEGESVVVDELFSRERLVTEQQAIDYVQRLVDDLDATTRVLDCELGGPLALIRSGKEFSCRLDNAIGVVVTVAGNGSGSISDFTAPD